MNVPPETLKKIAERRLAGAPWQDIEAEFSMSHNTARRKLKEAGYQTERGEPPDKGDQLWNRPCMRCKSTERRSKFLFFCKLCRFENSESGIPGWMTGVKTHHEGKIKQEKGKRVRERAGGVPQRDGGFVVKKGSALGRRKK